MKNLLKGPLGQIICVMFCTVVLFADVDKYSAEPYLATEREHDVDEEECFRAGALLQSLQADNVD
jgi:hypothetical protein